HRDRFVGKLLLPRLLSRGECQLVRKRREQVSPADAVGVVAGLQCRFEDPHQLDVRTGRSNERALMESKSGTSQALRFVQELGEACRLHQGRPMARQTSLVLRAAEVDE